MLGTNEASSGRSSLQANTKKLPDFGRGVAPSAGLKESPFLLTPIPMGERRSSGMSAPHTTYLDESHLSVDVTVADVKEGCALGLVLEQFDETGALIAAENVSTYIAPRAHQHITTAKGCRWRVKWILTGLKPSSTFAVNARGMSLVSTSTGAAVGRDRDLAESPRVDLTTFGGLREYLEVTMPVPEPRATAVKE